MRRLTITLAILFLISFQIKANGVGIIDAGNGVYLRLLESAVDVTVENQIAIVKTTQLFQNQLGDNTVFKYGFPLPNGASAIGLRWQINGIWKEAAIAGLPQDTTLPGGETAIDAGLKTFLGDVPLYYSIGDTLQAGDQIMIELTYAELLDYKFGEVNFYYPNDYSLIQSFVLNKQELAFNLYSQRTIESIDMPEQISAVIANDGAAASINFVGQETAADENYHVIYSLNLDELGLFGFTTMLHDTLVPDELGGGFFGFIAEPDPGETTEAIDKVFTLIIDRSGSMSGNKIVQARNAATFIIENLNLGDKFNIIDFSGSVSNFKEAHVEFNLPNKNDALNYISTLNAGGYTNISGAFETAIPQFAAASGNTANIIIFFTDGEATSGVTTTDGILQIINDKKTQFENQVAIFTFGIGSSVNTQLLTQIASQNNGISQFLGNDELEVMITDFYLQIRNPVLLNTQMSFTPDILSEVFPNPLPNLYKGQQMLVSGRYSQAQPVTLKLSGEAFGNPVEYEYIIQLSDIAVEKNQFLPKIWAKNKIENLLVQYHSLTAYSEEANQVKEDIIELSLAYSVITEFTSFSGTNDPGGGSTTEVDDYEDNITTPDEFKIVGNYPNPFNPSTTIVIAVNKDIYKEVKINIYNAIGQLVRVLSLDVNGKGVYEIKWDGKLANGATAESGVYIYTLRVANMILADKMVLVK